MNLNRHVVFDTGILVSAAIRPHSVPALAFEKALSQFRLCASDETLAELRGVLSRPKFDRYLKAATREQFLSGLIQHLLMVPVTTTVSDCRDPKDNMFLALAETAEAELIVASDPHLTDLNPWHNIPIIPPQAFLVGV